MIEPSSKGTRPRPGAARGPGRSTGSRAVVDLRMERKLNILFADDDPTFAALARRALAHEPELADRYHLECLSDGSEVLDYMLGRGSYGDRTRSPIPDVILMDERMCRMDGSEVLREIKRDPATCAVPVCIMSAASEDRLRALCYAYGASFCMTKPLDFADLERKLTLFVRFFMEVAGTA
jgi:two-component system, response regulator